MINKNFESYKSLSNRMKRNVQKIDLLIQDGFEVKGSVKEQTLTDPDGVPINLWDWVPLLGNGLPGNNRNVYDNYQFPKFSWLAFFFPVFLFLRIKNWGYLRLFIAIELIYEVLIRSTGVDFTNIFASGSTIGRIGVISTVALIGFHIICGQIYPYLVWNSLNKNINYSKFWICIISYIIYNILYVIF